MRARAIAYLGHLPALKADLAALENLEFLCGLHGRRRAPAAGQRAGASSGLAGYEDALARQLSAGQKKRLSLARLWLSPAPLWLLDEPYANLDLDGIEPGQPHGAGAPARWRRRAGDHAWRVCRAAGAHADAGAGARRMMLCPGRPRRCCVRDLRLLWRRRGDALQPALFALLVVVLFALALGGEHAALAKVAPAVLWVAVLLAGLLSLDTLFRGDAEDGSLEQWMLAPVPLAWLVLVRTLDALG